VRKPDIDNAIKLVMDGLNGVAWADDAQVTSVSAVKADRTRDCEASMLVSVEWCDVERD
jgi:Holliday junction resolvase RusA-like endonuclease